MESDILINKVAESRLVTIDLEEFYPRAETAVFDMKDHLFMGMILKEKDFREKLKGMDLSPYKDKNVALTCTADAVIPMWAYMLAASYLQPMALDIVFGTPEFMQQVLFLQHIAAINANDYADKRVVIKGCGELPISETAYVAITKLLRPVVRSIMYGEPCSTVPIFKKSKES